MTWQAERQLLQELVARITLLYATNQVTEEELQWLTAEMHKGSAATTLARENMEQGRAATRAILEGIDAKVAGIAARSMVGLS